MPRINWQAEVAALRKDNRSGAQEITERALELLMDVIAESIPGGAVSYRQWLVRLSRDLVAAQPSMASLFRLVNDMLWACHKAMGAQEMREKALAFLDAYRTAMQDALEQLAHQAAEFLAQYPVMMTYSRSSTLLRACRLMAERKVAFRVLCSEARPMYEGQTLASELAWAGIEVVVGIDMALFGWLEEANALVLGSDSLSNTGVVNKIGTAALVHAAAERDIPRVILCTTNKFLPEGYLLEQRLSAGPPEEIMPVSDRRITVRNVYFDVTPLEEISFVISERGVLGREDLLRALASIQVYPGLRGQG